MEAKRFVNEKELPAEYQALFDSAQPLPPGAQLIEMPPVTLKGAMNTLAVGAGICVLAGLFLLVYIADWRAWKGDPLRVSNGPMALAIGCAIVGLITIWIGMTKLKVLRATVGKANRYGVFLTPGALVFRDLQTCRFFPRSSVLSVQMEKTERDGITFLNSHLHFRNAEGVDDVLNNADDFLADTNRISAVQAIERWIAASNTPGSL